MTSRRSTPTVRTIYALKPLPEPDYDDPKEIYAFFGLTYCKAAVLEHAVLNLAVAILAKHTPGITGGDGDKLYEAFDKKTFGLIINAANAKFAIPADIEADLALAVEQRNYLTHRFFVVHDVDLMVPSARRKMIDGLIEILEHLRSIDARMDPIWMTACGSFGITQEWIEQQMQEYVAHRQANDA